MTRRTITVVTAGLSQPSATRLLADRLAAATTRALADRGVAAEVTVVELRELGHDLVDNLLTGFPSPSLRAVLDATAAADGVVAVTPIFSASYSGLFKTFFDLLDDDAIAGTPVLMAATAGTARHSLALEHALRPMFAYLRAVTVPTAVFAAAEDWGTGGGTATRGLAERIDRAAGELAALVAASEPRAAADPFDVPTSFDQLLAGG
jgi:FMN reductase